MKLWHHSSGSYAATRCNGLWLCPGWPTVISCRLQHLLTVPAGASDLHHTATASSQSFTAWPTTTLAHLPVGHPRNDNHFIRISIQPAASQFVIVGVCGEWPLRTSCSTTRRSHAHARLPLPRRPSCVPELERTIGFSAAPTAIPSCLRVSLFGCCRLAPPTQAALTLPKCSARHVSRQQLPRLLSLASQTPLALSGEEAVMLSRAVFGSALRESKRPLRRLRRLRRRQQTENERKHMKTKETTVVAEPEKTTAPSTQETHEVRRRVGAGTAWREIAEWCYKMGFKNPFTAYLENDETLSWADWIEMRMKWSFEAQMADWKLRQEMFASQAAKLQESIAEAA